MQDPRGQDNLGEEAATTGEVSGAIIDRLRAGDIAALEDVFHVYGGRIFSVCVGILGNRADAEDATQEVFLRAFQQTAKFSGRSRYSTWLLRLAANHTLNVAKASNRRKRLSGPMGDEPASAASHASDSAIGRERSDELARLLQELPLEQRQVLVLRELAGLSYAELAEVFGVRVGTVTSRLVRGREAMRALAEKSGFDAIDTG